MRYELSDYEWTAIKPMLPNKPRGVRRVNDRRVLNLGPPFRCAMARPARDLWSPHHLRGGLTSKIHAVVDTNGLPVHLALTPGEAQTIGCVRLSSAPCLNTIEQCRRVATRYDKLAANYLAFIKLASIRIWLRANESTP